jgi:methyl-accepting chemotaxis protein
MKGSLGQRLILLGAACVALVFVKLMYDMNANMARMTGYVGSLSQDVAAMRVSMERMTEDMAKMGASMQSMDANMKNMGSAVQQGGKLFKQWNPTEMMR